MFFFFLSPCFCRRDSRFSIFLHRLPAWSTNSKNQIQKCSGPCFRFYENHPNIRLHVQICDSNSMTSRLLVCLPKFVDDIMRPEVFKSSVKHICKVGNSIVLSGMMSDVGCRICTFYFWISILLAKITDWKNCVFKNLFRVSQNLVNGSCHWKPGKLVNNMFPGLMASLSILILVILAIDMTCLLKLYSCLK